jgi:hypothetical protein
MRERGFTLTVFEIARNLRAAKLALVQIKAATGLTDRERF